MIGKMKDTFVAHVEFAEGSRSVQASEPEGASSTSVSLTVERTGGATGVVTVSWSLTADNGETQYTALHLLSTQLVVLIWGLFHTVQEMMLPWT